MSSNPQLKLLIQDRRQKKRATHGGRRPGAGRPNGTGLRGHAKRPRLLSREPIHVTLKLQEGLPSLRRKDVFKILRAAVGIARKKGLAVAQFSILSNHVHLILELRGAQVGHLFQSLCSSFAKRLNRALKRKGSVFFDRYHVHVLKTPTEVRRALAYVLTNRSVHEGRRTGRMRITVRLDPFSSATVFDPWHALLGRPPDFEPSGWPEDVIENFMGEILEPARTWLLTRGWLRARSG